MLAIIIEDQKDLADIYSEALHLIGYETQIIADGQEALNILKEISPQLIILDMNLPRISGHYVLKTIRADARFHQIPVIICTANSIIANSLGDSITDLDRIIMKPVNIVDFQKVARALTNR